MQITVEELTKLCGELAISNLLLERDLAKSIDIITELKKKIEATPIEQVEFEGKNGLCVE